MPLDKPSLDSRTFDQLTTEARRKIPQLAPAWTDHNASDPGITLSELVAALVEQDLYRLDRIPDRVMRGFLRLVGIEQRPAGVAAGAAVLSAAIAVPSLPSGLQIFGAGTLVESTRPLVVSPATIVAALGGPAAKPLDLLPALMAAASDSLPFGLDPQADDCLTIGFDKPLGAPGAPVSLAVWRHDTGADAATWAALIAEWRATRRDARLLGGHACCERPLRNHDDVAIAWEYWSTSGEWAALPKAKDTTRGFSLSGWLRFVVPSDHALGGPMAGRYFIRARLISGRYTCAPAIQGIRLNAVAIRHAARVQHSEELGTSHGRAGERYPLEHTPVVAGSVRITWSKGAEQQSDWSEVASWDLVGSSDRAFVLDPSDGILSFGNGRQGRVPTSDWTVTADYAVGGGLAGNLPRGSLQSVPANDHNLALVPTIGAIAAQFVVEQPFTLAGGAEAETLAQTKARAIDRVARVSKAVTLSDYEALSLEVPGLDVARVRALPRHHVLLPCVTASGCITVVVVPNCSGPKPYPQPGFLAAVASWLDRRRMITADVRVVAPCYDDVAVTATLKVTAGADAGLVEQRTRAALDAFFNVLTGGPEGGGWPIGRPVYRSEVMALLAALPEVEAVTGLGLSGPDDDEPICTNLEFCPDCLPVSGAHQITVLGSPAARAARRSQRNDCI